MNLQSPKTIILNIGSELLHGTTLNSNSYYLAQKLDQNSFPVLRQIAVHDNRIEILNALTESAKAAEIIVITGGLGPTFDDITSEVVAEFADEPLVPSNFLLNRYKKLMKRTNHRIKILLKRQILVPRGCSLLNNTVGVASGFMLTKGAVHIAVLPGVPREMEEMTTRQLLPRLNRIFTDRTRFHHFTFRLKGIGETRIVSRLQRDFFKNSKLNWGIYPLIGEVVLRMYFTESQKKEAIKSRRYCIDRLRKHIYSLEDESLEAVVGKMLTRSKHTLGLAESITGGRIGDRITSVPGSSRYFLGSIVAYANVVKHKLLGVNNFLLHRFGAVSKETASAMALGARKSLRADYGLSVTGIAGPTGKTRNKPIGLVFIAIAFGNRVYCRKYEFRGDRDRIKQLACTAALGLLYDILSKEK